jgi:hypothetical protein
MLVKESISFQRGADPKNVLGIGQQHLIEKWLKQQQIYNYTINDDMTIDVRSSVILDKDIGNIPEYIQFGKINGIFNCNDCGLTTLRGCPTYVEDSFFCSRNMLTSLQYAPKIVEDSFWCTGNIGKKLTEKEVRKYSKVGRSINLKTF